MIMADNIRALMLGYQLSYPDVILELGVSFERSLKNSIPYVPKSMLWGLNFRIFTCPQKSVLSPG